MTEIVCIFFGVLCLGYFAGIWAYAGLSSKFPLVWVGMGAAFLGAALLLESRPSLLEEFEAFFLFLKSLLLAGAILFLAVELLILRAMRRRPEEGLDYILVLGAQVRGRRPSQSLLYRIQEAESYLKENPETKAVLSGGRGPGEDISEADCMYRELRERGISPERLLREDRSASTKENIEFSSAILKQRTEGDFRKLRLGIVTNGFHVFRGVGIAKKKMDCQIQGIPGKSNPFLQPNYMLREFFCVVKDKLAGNL